jgi:hypothetical protein
MATLRFVGFIKQPKTIKRSDFTLNLVFPFNLICLVLLTLTGFVPPVLLGTHLSGYLLMFHLVIGALFALGMVILGLLWSHEHRFDQGDWQTIKQLKQSATDRKCVLWQKIFYWIMEALSLPLVFSIVASMYKLFGTHGQEFLLQLHRYSALAVMIGIIGYTCALKICTQPVEAIE